MARRMEALKTLDANIFDLFIISVDMERDEEDGRLEDG